MKILSALFAASCTLSGLIAADAAPADGAAAAKPYPLTTCIVSGEALGSMGKAVSMVHDGQEVKLCCKGCTKKFNKDPAGYVAKMNEEAAKPAAEPVESPAAAPAEHKH